MTIDRFTREEFEEVLDEIFDKWEVEGDIWGELAYIGTIGDQKFIRIMSSINPGTGIADNTGMNSIRVWIVNWRLQPLMPKINHWTTRVPGWQARLKSQVQLLVNMSERLKYCEVCKDFEHVWKVKKNNRNKGRLFARCGCKDSFRWFE